MNDPIHPPPPPPLVPAGALDAVVVAQDDPLPPPPASPEALTVIDAEDGDTKNKKKKQNKGKTKSEVQSHDGRMKVHKQRVLKCFCLKKNTFHSLGALQDHQSRTHSNERKLIVCKNQKCKLMFNSNEEFAQHKILGCPPKPTMPVNKGESSN